jgi:hypothetical protein
MSYHRFNNLRELFQGHLNKVLLRNVDSEDLRDRPCNCPDRGSCRYNNICRKALIVYKVKIPQTGEYYIGATSQTLNKRVAGHLQDTRDLLRDGVRSSTLASHLAQMWQRNSNLSTGSKTFGKLACKLCQKERVALLRHSWSDGANMLNNRSEIHGHVAILQGSIGYACGPVLMIPLRVKGLCFVYFKFSGQAAGCGLSPASGCRVPVLWM